MSKFTAEQLTELSSRMNSIPQIYKGLKYLYSNPKEQTANDTSLLVFFSFVNVVVFSTAIVPIAKAD